MPTIAAIEGGCYGAGVALALACDIRVAGEDARFAVTPAKLGIGYPRQDVARLVRQVGRGHAARLLFTACAIDADEALAIGLVEARGDARAVAETIASYAPEAVGLLKRTLDHPEDARLDLAFEAALRSADVSVLRK
jgi:enoyl-CoA hydratase